MSDCRFGVSPVNYPVPDPDPVCKAGMTLKSSKITKITVSNICNSKIRSLH